MNLSRRGILTGLSLVGAAAVAPAMAKASKPVTREGLERYYAFLWAEHFAVARELGVEAFDHYVANKSGGDKYYRTHYAGKPPSERMPDHLTA